MKRKKDIVQRHWYLNKHHIILCSCGALTHAVSACKAPTRVIIKRRSVKTRG